MKPPSTCRIDVMLIFIDLVVGGSGRWSVERRASHSIPYFMYVVSDAIMIQALCIVVYMSERVNT